MSLDNIKYQAWYHFYKISNKLGLWRMYSGYDQEFGIPYVTSYWFWQSKPQDVVILGQEDN